MVSLASPLATAASIAAGSDFSAGTLNTAGATRSSNHSKASRRVRRGGEADKDLRARMALPGDGGCGNGHQTMAPILPDWGAIASEMVRRCVSQPLTCKRG